VGLERGRRLRRPRARHALLELSPMSSAQQALAHVPRAVLEFGHRRGRHPALRVALEHSRIQLAPHQSSPVRHAVLGLGRLLARLRVHRALLGLIPMPWELRRC